MDLFIKSLLNVLVFAAVMSIIVVIHELGHLIAAKRFGVYCKEFAIGMGPVLYKRQSKRSETAYSIRAFPIGGFVSMAGEPGEVGMDDVPLERTVNGIARWKRLIIMLAGVFMNLVLAFVVFASIFQIYGVVQEPKPIIAEVVEGGAAFDAGLKDGDEITKLEFYNGTVVIPNTFTDVILGINSFEDNPIQVTYRRDGTESITTMTPQYNEEAQSYKIGVYSVNGELLRVSFFDTLAYTFSYIGTTIAQLLRILGWLLRGIGLSNIGGPIAIFQQTSKVTSNGFDMLYFWNLIGALSISLAVMNLMPIPVFDGGRALITIVEMVIRRPIPKKLENAVMLIGFAMMIGLMIFFVIHDISRL